MESPAHTESGARVAYFPQDFALEDDYMSCYSIRAACFR